MKYKKIVQKPYCCVGSCIEMILNRNKISNQGQIDIACNLGLIVPQEYSKIYPNAIIGEKPDAGFGTQIQKEEYSINNFFKKNNINLKEEYHYITEKNDIKKFLIENKENDIVICCHAATLYNDPQEDWGHMILFESIKDDVITILDPSAKRDYENIDIERLSKSISVHKKENGAGFYLIKKIKTS